MQDQKNKNYKNMIEALLFASGRYMSIDTLMNLTKAENKEIIHENIKKLKQEYDSRASPLMLVEEKDGFKLTVREQYLQLVRKIISETELPKTILETLAVIAWKNPAKQSDIIQIRHNKAYDHIAELEDLGFVKKEKKGRSFILKLTEKFYDYFDIDGVKNIKDVFKRVVEKNIQKTKDLNQNSQLLENKQQTLQEPFQEGVKTEEKAKKEDQKKNEIQDISGKILTNTILTNNDNDKNEKKEFHELD